VFVPAESLKVYVAAVAAVISVVWSATPAATKEVNVVVVPAVKVTSLHVAAAGVPRVNTPNVFDPVIK
jgi:hypothetical protein